MTIVTLIAIEAQDAGGAALPIRLASHDRPDACHLGGEQWDPALATLPDFALDFFGGAFAGQVTAPRTGFTVATNGLAGFAATASARARFADARVRVWVGDITSGASADLGPLTLRFDGRITAEPQIDAAARIATFEAAVKDSWADEPLLALFAGTGGIEGPADLTGQPKPLALGNIRFAGGTLIDRVDNVWMVSDGSIQGWSAVYDRLVSLGASAGNFADLAALKAASIPNGSWGTCLAQGLVRLGAPPDGRVSFDLQGSNSGTGGFVRRAGAIIRRIVERKGGTVNAASLTALDSARPYNLQLQLREQTTAREVIQQIADSVAAVAGVSLTGELFAQPLGIGTPTDVLAADDSAALRVASVEEQPIAAPSWKLATEAELTFELHSADEAAFEYRWQGEYSAARVYRMDDVVTGPDSAAWAYINATPAAEQALPVWPVTSNAYWKLFQAPGGAGIRIVDGVIEGIATPPVFIDNKFIRVRGNIADLPATGDFDGQMFEAIDTGEVKMWNGSGAVWITAADITEEKITGFPFGGNSLVNSDFAKGLLGWRSQASNRGLNLPTWHGRRNVFYANPTTGVFASGAISDALFPDTIWLGSASGAVQVNRFALPVKPGDRLYARALLAPHRCTPQTYLLIFDRDLNLLSAPFTLGGGTAGGAANGENMAEVSVLHTVTDSTAAFAIPMWRMIGTGESNPFLFIAEPAMGKLLPGQTAIPPYQPGRADPIADETVSQPIVGLLDPATGQATSRRINSQIMASGVLQLLDTNPLTASTDGSGVATITINAHVVYDDVGTLSFSSASIGGLAAGTTYYVYEANPGFVGGARSYVATTDRTALATFGRRFVGFITTPAAGSPPADGGTGGGAGGWPGTEIP